ncbi:MAG TPA: DMT family transporter [Rickettsiales bacterium]|nr:DMT family transporter [Rickettsiales bacterium]
MFLKLTDSSRTYAIAALAVGMLSIQTGASLAKHLFHTLSPLGVVSLRLLFAACILIAVGHPWRRWPKRNEWFSLFAYGLSLGSMNLLFYMAIARIPLGIAIALEFSGPLAIALLHTRSWKDFLWAVCAAGGIVLLLPVTKLSSNIDPVGAAYALGAATCWAIYIIFGKKTSHTVHGGTATALGMSIAACFVFPIGFAQHGLSLFNFAILPMALSVAILSSALPYSLEMFALRKLPTRTFSILSSMEPAIGAVCGVVFLSETLGAIQLFAIGMVILASAGSTWTAEEAESTAELVP